MKLIGINGLKRSGKNTVFEIVKDICAEDGTGERVAGIGFADKLKIMAARALGFEGADAEMIALMDEYKEVGFLHAGRDGRIDRDFTGREYLQWFGGEARKVFGENFWIDQVLPENVTVIPAGEFSVSKEVAERYKGTDILCITDLRYPNEAERIRAHNGLVWQVVRPGLVSDGHDSEQPLPEDLVHWTITNDRGLTELRTEVADAMSNCGV